MARAWWYGVSLTGLVFLAAFAIGLALAFVRHPIYGLYTYVAVFYLDPPSRWWGMFLPNVRWSLVAAVLTLLACLRLPKELDRDSWLKTTPARLLVIFTVWIWIQYSWALDPHNQLELAVLFTKYVVLFYVVYRILDSAERITGFLLAHVAGCFYLSLLAFSASFSGRLEGVGGPGIDEANALAMHMGTGVLAGSMLILGNRGWRQWLCLTAMPFLLNAIVLAGSRGAFLGLLAGALMLVYLRPPAYRRLFWALAVLSVVLFGLVAPNIFWERMRTITAPVDEPAAVDIATESRIELIKAQWKMTKRYPFGSGHRGTAVLSAQYLDSKYLAATRQGPVEIYGQRSSHNTFMTILSEQGVPGAAIFLALVYWVAATLRRLRKVLLEDSANLSLLTAAVGSSLVLVLVAGQFTDYLKAEVQIWCLTLLACISCLALKDQPRKRWIAVPVASTRSARPS